MKMFGNVFFIVVMAFILFVVLAPSPVGRIQRTCMPVTWTGRAATTIGAMFSPRAENAVQEWAGTAFDACRFFIFRQFYADDLAQHRAASGRGTSEPDAEHTP